MRLLCINYLLHIIINISMSANKDYYEILKVTINATVPDIKTSYKKLAMKYHPDKNVDADKQQCEEMFKEISEAYQVLSNIQTRKTYDDSRKQSVKHLPHSNFSFSARDPFEVFKANFNDNFFNTNSSFGKSMDQMNKNMDIMKASMNSHNNRINSIKQNTSFTNYSTSSNSNSNSHSFNSVSSSSSCVNGKMKKKVTKIGTINGKTIKEVTEIENNITTVTTEVDGVTTTTVHNPNETKVIKEASTGTNMLTNKDDGIIE
jgi:DnaJ-class molecular chaperone